jgi:16S rRNA (guanine527-N7)-methyltransferase
VHEGVGSPAAVAGADAGLAPRIQRVLDHLVAEGQPPDAVPSAGHAVTGTIESWLTLLQQWNARIDLTAARSEDELVDLMLADAAILAGRIANGARVVDVGTGAGAPGLALALLRPDLEVTLVEPLAKRSAFLRTVLGTLRRSDVKLLREKGEAVANRKLDWDVAISRATLPPASFVPLGLTLAPKAWVLLAREEPPRVDQAQIEIDVTYAWPLTGASRRAVRYDRRVSQHP